MAEPVHGRDNTQIERVAGMVCKSPDPALAQDNAVVPLSHDVFRGHEKLVESGGEPALEEHGFLRAAGGFEQRKILHVPGADLDDVRIALDQIEAFTVDSLGYDLEADFRANLGQDSQAFFAQALKAVRRRPRLVGAASEKPGARGAHGASYCERLLERFDRAGPGGDYQIVASDEDAAS